MSQISFPETLRRYRRAADLTQEQLAERTACAVATLRSFEAGRRRPSREMAERLADVLAVPVAERAAFIQLARFGTPPAPVPPPAAALLNAERRPYQVPLPATQLIGRRRELAQIVAHLTAAAVRLVTVLGPGGMGKTRLALQAAADTTEHFADGAAFVALGSVVNAGDAAGAIAAALGCPLSGVAAPETDLIAFLRERELLLLLDNLEHLLNEPQGDRLIDFLGLILVQAPRVRLLVTSRERLRMRNEWVIELDGLALPHTGSLSAIERSDSVLLFIERAHQVAGGFTLTVENRRAVAQLCRMLGGMPLGIELAAAWVHLLSPAEIAREIGHNQDLLSSSARDVPDRHRSLRAAFDYSWSLLNADERRTLRRLAVFRGPFSRDAAMAVLAGSVERQEPLPGLALLASLIDKSLLRIRSGEAETSRYELHEQIRQYAESQLRQDPAEETLVRRLHAHYYAAWLDRHEHELKSAAQRQTIAAINHSLDNVRAAWAWAIEQRAAAQLIQLAYAFGWFAELQGRNPEFAHLTERAAAALRPHAADAAAERSDQIAYWLMVSLEGWACSRFAPARAVGLMQAALAPLRSLGDDRALFQALITPAYVAIFVGDEAGARAMLDEAIAAAQRADFPWGVATALSVRCILETLYSDGATAQRAQAAALNAARTCGDPRHIALALNYGGRIALDRGDLDTAEHVCREALTIGMTQRDRYQIGLGLLVLGCIAQARADFAAAVWLLQEAHTIAGEICDRWLEAQVLGAQGMLAAARSDTSAAGTLLRQALAAAVAAPATVGLDLLAALAAHERTARPLAAQAALIYLRHHRLTRPATRAAAADLMGEPSAAATELAATHQSLTPHAFALAVDL